MAHRYIIYPPNGPRLNDRPVGCCECGRWADCVDPVTICPNAGKLYSTYLAQIYSSIILI